MEIVIPTRRPSKEQKTKITRDVTIAPVYTTAESEDPPQPTSKVMATSKPVDTTMATSMPCLPKDSEPTNTDKFRKIKKGRGDAPVLIKAVIDRYTDKGMFDIVQFLNNVPVIGLSLADLLYESPHLRRELADALKTVKRDTKVKLMQSHPFLSIIEEDDIVESGTRMADVLQARIHKLTISRTSTHFVMAQINGVTTTLHLDSGCCLICVHSRIRRQYGWELAQGTSSVHLQTATGNAPMIEGEVHNVIVKITEGVEIPLNVVSINNLDVDILLGRPFLEMLNTITDNQRGIYHLRWNSQWVVVDGTTGQIESQRRLTKDELEDWGYCRPPRWNKTTTDNVKPKSQPQRRKPKNNVYKITTGPDSDNDFTIEIDSQYDLEADIQEGGVANIYRLMVTPATVHTHLDPMVENNEATQDLRVDMLTAADADTRRLFLTRTSSKRSGNDMVSEVWQPQIMDKLTIVSWNVNSIRNLLRKTSEFVARNGGNQDDALPIFLERHGIDIFCVQEHRLTDIHDARPYLAHIPGYTAYFSFAGCNRGYSGVAVYAREGLVQQVVEGFRSHTIDQLEGRIIQCFLPCGTVVINLYMPNARNMPMERTEYKQQLLGALEKEVEALRREERRVVLIGDWNMVFRKEDVWNPREMTGIHRTSPCAEWEERWVHQFMEKHDLYDPYTAFNQAKRPRFSAWEAGKIGLRTRRELDRGFRIDYALVSKELRNQIKTCHLTDVPGSDHIPVYLRMEISGKSSTESAHPVAHPRDVPTHRVCAVTTKNKPAERVISSARLEWQPYDGQQPSPVYQLDTDETGGRQINIGDLRELKPYTEQIKQLFLEHLPEIIAPGEIARTLTGVQPMTAQLDMSDTTPLPRARVTRWTETEERVLNEYDEKMTKAGKLEPSTSTTSSRPILVKKKDGSWRIVLNFAPINRRIIPLVWPLEPTDKVLQKMAKWNWLSTFDHSLGYHQCPLDKMSRWLTAVVFPRGLRQYTVAPMGWKDSAEWMAYHMSIMYDDAQYEGDNQLAKHMGLFRDDGSIGTDDIETHICLLGRLLRCVQRHNGTLSDKKSFWFVQRAICLGFLVGQGQILPEEKKITAILRWPTPDNQRQLRAFVGFLLFFSHCIPNLGKLLGPLYPLYKTAYAKPLLRYRDLLL